MSEISAFGPLLALASAIIWGTGDFCGGLAGRRLHAFQVAGISGATGLAAVMFIAVVTRENWPSMTGALWALAGGAAGGLGIALLYRGLSQGSVPIVASVSSFVGAGVPVAASAFLEGVPGPAKLTGFALGLIAIALISASGAINRAKASQSLTLGLLAGLGFGAFFVCMARTDTVFTSLALARVCTFGIALLLMAGLRLKIPSPVQHPFAMVCGVLDAGGNALYVLAKQFTRLDVAAVLSSMYPASTILLAAIFLKERVSPWQGVGIVVCLIAIGLIVV